MIVQGINYPLFSRDSTGKTREWRMELQGSRYRTISGLMDGQKTTTGWTTATPKNVGRSNATSDIEQALAEVIAAYEDKLRRGYSKTFELAGHHTIFKPMLAKTFESFDAIFSGVLYSQPKLDGMRCVARIDGLWSRNGKPIIAAPHIRKALQPMFEKYPDAVIDGELYNHDLADDFNSIISHAKKTKPNDFDLKQSEKYLQYHIYDCAIDAPFAERFEWLEANIPKFHHLALVRTDRIVTSDGLDRTYASYLEDGYEGQMVRLNKEYAENKRSPFLLKRKEFMDQEFPIVRLEEGNGNWAGLAKRVICMLPDGREFGAGIRGSQPMMRALLLEASRYVGANATVRFQNWTPDGIPRFPVVVHIFKGERE